MLQRRLLRVLPPILAVVAFAPVLANGFAYDDWWTYVDDRLLDLPFSRIVGAMIRGEAHGLGLPDASRPAMVVSAMIDRRLFGASPFGPHLHSLALHALATCLAYGLAFVVARKRSIALVAALVFAVAPIHAEVVASANYREDLIATIGAFGFTWLLLAPSAERHEAPRALLASAALAYGLLGKESALSVVLFAPLLALLLGARGPWLARRELTLTLASVVLVLYGSWRFALALGGDGVARGERSLDLATRLLATGRYELFALVGASLPIPPAPIRAPLPPPHLAYALVAALPLALVLLRRRLPRAITAGLVLALVAPLVSAPLSGAANEWADRYLYPGVLGGGLIAGYLVDRLARARPRLASALVIVATCLGVVGCWTEARCWRDDASLFRHAVRVQPDAPRAWVALAHQQRVEGRFDAAERSLVRALRLAPDDPRAWIGRVLVARLRGDRARALRLLAELEARSEDPVLLRTVRACIEGDDATVRRCAGVGSRGGSAR